MARMNTLPRWHAIESATGHIACTQFLPQGSDESAVPLVVCCHGLTGTRIGSCYRYPQLGRRLVALGIGCITFDFTGCGESSGAFDALTPQSMRADLQAVLNWVQGKPWCDADRIGLCASSFGAVTASGLAEATRIFKTATLWAPVAHPRRLIEMYMNDDAWTQLRAQGWLRHRGLRLGQAFFEQVVEENQDAATQLAHAKISTLIFHGSGDTEVPFDHAQAYEASLKQADVEFKLVTLDTDDHGMRDVDLSDRLIEETAQWMRDRLR